MRNKVIILVIALVIIIGMIALFYFGRQRPEQELSGTINFWGVFDNFSDFEQVISAYKVLHPRVEINYRELSPATYERDLINALASGVGAPDLFMFQSSWLPKHFDKVAPLSTDAVSLNNFANLFPTVVQQDFAPDGVIYALPLYVDTLAMFYNSDIFDNKKIAVPPKTWEEFEALVPKLRTLDKTGRLQKPAAAIGGSAKSINRATDILNLVMLQTGTKMVSEDFSAATFDSAEGLNALDFYTKFADSLDSAYTWNDSFTYSLDSFAAGETAIMFNYSHQIAFLREKSPFLNFRIAPMLQPRDRAQDVNWANYWGVAVSNKTPLRGVAQDFALFLATNPDGAGKYLAASGRPPALRSLIAEYAAREPQLGIFANQALTARSWPQIDNVAVEDIFNEMIVSVLSGRFDTRRSIAESASKVTDLMRSRAR